MDGWMLWSVASRKLCGSAEIIQVHKWSQAEVKGASTRADALKGRR